jgi:hypothetical protein
MVPPGVSVAWKRIGSTAAETQHILILHDELLVVAVIEDPAIAFCGSRSSQKIAIRSFGSLVSGMG